MIETQTQLSLDFDEIARLKDHTRRNSYSMGYGRH